LGKETKTIIALVAILVVCASIAIIGVSESLAGDESVTSTGTYYDQSTGITFTLYSDKTAEATKVSGSPAILKVPGEFIVDGTQYSVVSIGKAFGSRDKIIEQVIFPASVTELKDGSIFNQASKLKTVTFEEGSKLTYIGNSAFVGCMALENLDLPEGLKEIGTRVLSFDKMSWSNRGVLYYNLYSLKELVLPASLEKIGDGSFPTLIMDIKLAEGNNNFVIENGILYDINKTTLIRAFNPQGDVQIPSTVKTINPYALRFQTSDVMTETLYTSTWLGLTENPIKEDPAIGTVTIPSSVENIGEQAFALYSVGGEATKSPYKDLVIPSKLNANIGNEAFAYNPFVKQMYVAEGRSVSSSAYLGCKNIEEAYILQTQITAQYQNISAKTLVLSNQLTKIANYSINNWTNLNMVTYEGVDFESGVVRLPSTLTEIGGSNVFKGAAIETIDLSNFEGDLPNYLFSGLASVKKIEFGNEMTSIGSTSFQNLTSLTEITFPASLKTIGSGAFTGCTALTKIDFKEGLETIGSNSFQNLTLLTEITFPASLKTIGDSAFKGCTVLTKINFKEGLETIGSLSFQNLTSLTEITFPASLKTIGNNAFKGCKSIESIVVPRTATIDISAFPDNAKIEGNLTVLTMKVLSEDTVIKMIKGITVTEDNTVVTIPKEAIYVNEYQLSNQKIGQIVLEEGNESYVLNGGALYTKDMKTLVSVKGNAIADDGSFTIPDSVTTIGDYCFYKSEVIKTVKMTSNTSLSKVGKYAFNASALESFEFPSTIQEIGQSAFYKTALTQVDFTSVTQGNLVIGSGAFQLTNLGTVRFPTDVSVDIGSNAFASTQVQTVEIQKGQIGSYAFNNCKELQVLKLGAGVTKTASNYIANTTKLKQLIILNTDKDVIGKDIAASHITSTSKFTIVVPENSEADYSKFSAKYTVAKMLMLGNGAGFIFAPPTEGITVEMVETKDDDEVSYKYTLDEAYNRSNIVIKLGETEIEIENGEFTIKPSLDSIQQVELIGLKVNEYKITVNVDNATTTAVSSVTHGQDLLFNIIPNSGYVLKDVTVTVADVQYPAHHASWISFSNIIDDMTIQVNGVVPEEYSVIFIKDGEVLDTSKVKNGEKASSNNQSESWYLYGSQVPFDFNQVISENKVLFASPVSEDSKVCVDFYVARGSLNASWIGGQISSGDTVLKQSDVTFTYDGAGDYFVVGWYINGKYEERSDNSITVTQLDGDLSVHVAVMYEQAGYKYTVNAPMILPDEEYAKMIWIGTYKDPLDMGADYYANMPSGYTTVGDYLFMVSGKDIIRVNLNGDFTSGMPTDTLKITPESVDKTIDYFGGYIFNGVHVYDLELNYLLDVDVTPIGMHDGSFISLSNNRVTKYTIERVDEKYETKELWTLSLQKHYGQVVFDGDYLYHLPVTKDSDDPDRAIQSIDLANGKIMDTVDINEWQRGHYYDDGWLTAYDGWVYIASYTSGLFGDKNPYVTQKDPVILRVAVEGGVFDKDSVQTIFLPDSAHKSGFIVYKDRGYIHSGSQLLVVDMKTFTVIYKETGAFTHGGIVLNTYYANAENNYKVYIYMVPYEKAETIWVYTDDQTKTEASTPQKIEKTGASQYATTHVRTSASGYIYWYNDSSIFFITGQKYHEVSWVSEGKVLQTDSQAQNGAKLTLPTTPQKEGYVFLGWYNYDGTRITEDSVVAGDMTIMAIFVPAPDDSEFVDSVSIKQFVNGGMSVILSVDAGNNAPEKVLIVTYSAYIDLPEGTMLNPFLTECVEMGADETKVYFTPTLASKIESLTVTCCYEIDSILYSTPYVKAVAPTTYATMDLTIDPSLSLTLNDLTVVNGQSMRYGYYVVEVEGNDDAQYQVNGVVADGQNRLFYYGQALIVTKVGA